MQGMAERAPSCDRQRSWRCLRDRRTTGFPHSSVWLNKDAVHRSAAARKAGMRPDKTLALFGCAAARDLAEVAALPCLRLELLGSGSPS